MSMPVISLTSRAWLSHLRVTMIAYCHKIFFFFSEITYRLDPITISIIERDNDRHSHSGWNTNSEQNATSGPMTKKTSDEARSCTCPYIHLIIAFVERPVYPSYRTSSGMLQQYYSASFLIWFYRPWSMNVLTWLFLICEICVTENMDALLREEYMIITCNRPKAIIYTNQERIA